MEMTFAANLRYLRKKKGWNQQKAAEFLGVTRSAYASYEEGRAEPSLNVIQQICALYAIGFETLMAVNLSTELTRLDVKGNSLRVLSIQVTPTSEEMATVVPLKAAAGYATGYGDIEFIEDLPQVMLNIPEFRSGFTRRLFQIEGDSMLPLKQGTYIISRYVQDWSALKPNQCVVVVTRHSGIVYKRFEEQNGHVFKFCSDNKLFHDIEIDVSDIQEIWLAEGYISTQIPRAGENSSELSFIMHEIQELRSELKLGKT
jgi:transcriptional regulator with XRE-family HTH domain